MESELWLALAGGALIGLAAAALMFFNGRVAGISGIIGPLLKPQGGDVAWRLVFMAGLVLGGVVMANVTPDNFAFGLDRSVGAVVLAGLLVGFGTRMGSGCTSGHGVCGLARRSPRSAVATVTFISAGAVTVLLVNTLLGGSF